MWPFTVKCRCPGCAGTGAARYATFTLVKETSCTLCSGTGELHKVEAVREDVVNAFGFKTGTRRIGTRPRVDPCPGCGARGKVARTEQRRVKVPSDGPQPPTAEV